MGAKTNKDCFEFRAGCRGLASRAEENHIHAYQVSKLTEKSLCSSTFSRYQYHYLSLFFPSNELNMHFHWKFAQYRQKEEKEKRDIRKPHYSFRREETIQHFCLPEPSYLLKGT